MENKNTNRGCYCGALDKEFMDKNDIPEGYCGICERCGQPGHKLESYQVFPICLFAAILGAMILHLFVERPFLILRNNFKG